MTADQTPLTETELERIRANHDRATEDGLKGTVETLRLAQSASDVPRLLAEVDRLRAENAKLAEAFAAITAESAELQLEQIQLDRTARCGSCRQHESVDRYRAQWQAVATTARRYKQERDALAAKLDAVRALPTEPRCDHEGDCSDWSHGWDSGRNATLREVGRVLDGQPPLRDYSGAPRETPAPESPRPPAESNGDGPTADSRPETRTGVSETLSDGQASDEHDYLSTACHHGVHEHCRSATNIAGGPKTPGTCKFCNAKCRCRCHPWTKQPEEDEPEPDLSLIPVDLIGFNPGIRGGEPCIVGTRIPVAEVAGYLADGATWDEVRDMLPSLPSLPVPSEEDTTDDA